MIAFPETQKPLEALPVKGFIDRHFGPGFIGKYQRCPTARRS